MALHPLAGQPVPPEMIVDVARLVADYHALSPDVDIPEQRVSFGTSGHRGCASATRFNEDHILAIAQAIVDCRTEAGIDGPLVLGMDTHALSEPALTNAVEVFAGNGVELILQAGRGYTPTPVVSHTILTRNRGRRSGLADGVVVTPSHNPPTDGGIKYNPPNGGPADTHVTAAIEKRANRLLADKLAGVKRAPYTRAMAMSTTREVDLITPYVADLANVVDLAAVANAKLKIGVDPMGGAGIAYWAPIAERYGLDLTLVNQTLDPTFSFMHLDRDGTIRMDCSSPYAMAGLLALKDQFDIAFGNDPDYDRHGIVTPAGLMNPNHYLAVSAAYLMQHRPAWPADAHIGKTLVSSAMIDRVAEDLGHRLYEVPVGFKWFVDGLLNGTCGFAGEESAGASFLRLDGSVWTTDKDGIIMNLLAAEITAKTGLDPAAHYNQLTQRFGDPVYERADAPATRKQKARLAALSPADVAIDSLAGSPILAKLTTAPGNGASIGGLKVVARDGWFAARPSGTEDIYKIYAESFLGRKHLDTLLAEARKIVSSVLD